MNKNYIILLSSVAIASIIIIYLLSFGLSLTLDGIRYMWGAEYIESGVGYFELSKYQDKVIPITLMPPVYSGIVASFMMVFNLDSLKAAQLVNGVFGVLFYFSWFYLFLIHIRSYFVKAEKQMTVFIGISFLWLVLGANIWQFISKTGTDLIFVSFLAFVGIFFHYSNTAKTIKRQLMYTLLAGIFSSIAVLTRMVGMAIIIATILAYFFSHSVKERMNYYKIILYLIGSLSGLFMWFFRNSFYTETNHVSKSISTNLSAIFNFSKIFEILNYFAVDSFHISGRLESFAILILVPLFIILLIALFFKNTLLIKFAKPTTIWLLFSVFVYVSMIVYSGTTAGHNRSSGFMRYFLAIQPFVILLLLSLIIFFKKSNLKLQKYFYYFVIIFSVYSFASGTNKNRVYFSALKKVDFDQELINQIQTNVKPEDLLLSTNNKTIGFRTGMQCLYVEHPDRIKLLLTEWWKEPYERVYIVLNKNIGFTFKKSFNKWYEVLAELPQKKKIYENDSFIFVELDKKIIFEEFNKQNNKNIINE